MKKETKKEKKETDFELLARLVVDGFEKIGNQISSLKDGQESLKQGQESLKQGQLKLEQGQLKLEQRQLKLEQGQTRLEQRQLILEQRQLRLEEGYEGLRQEISSVKEEQKENTHRLISIEKKLVGMLFSLDETVHRNEFNKLERRVEALED